MLVTQLCPTPCHPVDCELTTSEAEHLNILIGSTVFPFDKLSIFSYLAIFIFQLFLICRYFLDVLDINILVTEDTDINSQ